MVQISVEDASKNLTSLIQQLVDGEEILLLEQGAVVARLLPPAPPQTWLAELRTFRTNLEKTPAPLSAAVLESRDLERF